MGPVALFLAGNFVRGECYGRVVFEARVIEATAEASR